MISVPGTITINTRTGRFGAFNVGTLSCSIGEFTVKDPSIEEFDEGVYDGDFVIEKIKPNSYFSSGRMVVEVRATLSAILLHKNTQPQPVGDMHLDQDPLELESRSISIERDEINGENEDSFCEKLFGVLYPLGNVVKLDPTINRGLFRQQRDYLKQNGYRFVADEQHWMK